MNEWTVESVTLEKPADADAWVRERLGIPADVVRCVVRGRMTTGQPWYWEVWSTMDFIKAFGEERLIETLKLDARPPATLPPESSG